MQAKSIPFNYIITIHNKQDLINKVLLSVIQCAGPDSCIYPVLDGCSDDTELIIDNLIAAYPETKIKKLFANDVHELKAINIGLNSANQFGDGYNIILQDDVVLNDMELERKCIYLYRVFNNLGIVSFRHGANLDRSRIYDQNNDIAFSAYVQSECGHYPDPVNTINIGTFTFKEIAIKSPICIPCKVVLEVGPPDERYAPWDDIAYCWKVSEAGYANGVFALNFISDVDWGTTRTKTQLFEPGEVIAKNIALFRFDHLSLPDLDQKKYDNRRYQLFTDQSLGTT